MITSLNLNGQVSGYCKVLVGRIEFSRYNNQHPKFSLGGAILPNLESKFAELSVRTDLAIVGPSCILKQSYQASFNTPTLCSRLVHTILGLSITHKMP